MAEHAMGTRLKIGSNHIAGLTSIGGVDKSADTIEKTTLESADNYREFIQGLKDGGEVAILGYFEPGDTNGQVELDNLFESGEVTAFSILFPPSLGAEWTFNAVVTNVSTGAEMEELATFEATIKITGKPNLGLTASGGLSGLSLVGTGGTLSPSFDNEVYFYTFDGVSASSVTVTATAADHTLKLFIDGEYSQDLTSASASSAIPLTIDVGKKLTILAYEDGKTTVTYEIIVVKTS